LARTSPVPYTTLFRSFLVWTKDGTIVIEDPDAEDADEHGFRNIPHEEAVEEMVAELWGRCKDDDGEFEFYRSLLGVCGEDEPTEDRKSTRLNSSHEWI